MARMKKDRTAYDLQAWELGWCNPSVAMIVYENKKDDASVIKIGLYDEIRFMPCDLASDSNNLYQIISFQSWLLGFNIHHKTDCKTMDDIKDYYRKEGAKLW